MSDYSLLLYKLYNQYGRGRITEEQFIMLFLQDELEEFIDKVKEEEDND